KIVAMALMSLIAMVANSAAQTPQAPARGAAPAPPPMTLTTNGWPDGDDIPVKYTQAAEQVSPQLTWSNAPANTQSFVLLMHDPDVSLLNTTDDQLHWLVWNIPGTGTGLPEHVAQGSPLPDRSRAAMASPGTW